MRRMMLRLTRGLAMGFGLVGCGVEDPSATSDTESLRSVEQGVYYVTCETDANGYQTGRCLDEHGLMACQLVSYNPPNTGCKVGKRYSATPSARCGIYVNDNACLDRIGTPPIEP